MTIIKELEYAKQVMHNAIAHHSPTNAQLVPEQRSPRPTPPSLYTGHGITWYGIPLWPLWVSCPGCVLCQLLVPLQFSRWLGIRSWKILDFRLNATEQQLKTSVLSTLFSYLTQKHSTVPATRKTINSIPAETRTREDVTLDRFVNFSDCTNVKWHRKYLLARIKNYLKDWK